MECIRKSHSTRFAHKYYWRKQSPERSRTRIVRPMNSMMRRRRLLGKRRPKLTLQSFSRRKTFVRCEYSITKKEPAWEPSSTEAHGAPFVRGNAVVAVPWDGCSNDYAHPGSLKSHHGSRPLVGRTKTKKRNGANGATMGARHITRADVSPRREFTHRRQCRNECRSFWYYGALSAPVLASGVTPDDNGRRRGFPGPQAPTSMGEAVSIQRPWWSTKRGAGLGNILVVVAKH